MEESNSAIVMSVAVLGGTGKEGTSLSRRWALNGYRVLIGSRSRERAVAHAKTINAELGGDYLTGMENSEAAKSADIVVLSVPYEAHQATLEAVKPHLSGKILIDVTVPLKPPKVRVVHLPEGNAAALEAQALLGDDVRVMAAFQTISYILLKDPDRFVDSDVLVCGNDLDAKHATMRLVEAAGMRGVDAGVLENAVALEALAPVLLHINKAHGVKHAGIRITGLDH